MIHRDHVALIKNGIKEKGGVWADFGSGSGAFTLALADLIGPEGEIYSIDTDTSRLREQQLAFKKKFPDANIHYIQGDMTYDLRLPPLDGIIAANSLHFIRQKVPILKHWKTYLKEGGRLLVVEYNVDQGNHWVPYPFSYETFENLAKDAGFEKTEQIGSIPSQFLTEIYSAVAY